MPSTIDVALDPERKYEFVVGVPEEKELSGARHSGVCGPCVHDQDV